MRIPKLFVYMRNLGTALLLAAVALTMAGPAVAGTTGSIRVYIRDEATRQPLAHTDIYLTGLDENFFASRQSSPPFTVFLNLDPGRYFLAIQYEAPLVGGCYAHVNVGADEDITEVLSVRPIPPNILGDPSRCGTAGPSGVTADVYDIF
jgi:hypothetical protein